MQLAPPTPKDTQINVSNLQYAPSQIGSLASLFSLDRNRDVTQTGLPRLPYIWNILRRISELFDSLYS
jgi:hypothetical protein